MKKLILVILMVFAMSTTTNAQYHVYQAKYFAMKTLTSNGYWTEWSNWKKSNARIVVDFKSEIVYINTEKKQKYIVIDDVKKYVDSSGGKQSEYLVIDQSDDIGKLRIRLERNGNQQLYVEFNDVIWVYSGLTKIN